MLAGPPTETVPVPRAVKAAAGGQPLRPVWANEVGGLTFEVGTGPGRRFLKWTPAPSCIDLEAEADRLAWAGSFHPVPRVLDQGTDERGSWLLMTAVAGENAVADRWKGDARTAVVAIGKGLRALHEALPVETCPFSWSAEGRLADVRLRADAGLQDPREWDPDHQSLRLDQALDLLEAAPPIDDLVVCHGDSCAPNTLIGDNGRWSGHVDLGSLGVADRWADLAVATWSTNWNYGPGWEDTLLDAYGVSPDPDRTRYYRLLWDLGP